MIHALMFSQLFVAITTLWVVVVVEEKSFKQFDKTENVALFAAVLFAPLTLIAFLGFFIYVMTMESRVEKINKIINRWKIDAHAKLRESTDATTAWKAIYGDKEELQYAALREALKNIPNKDIKLMFRTPPNIYKFEKEMYAMIIDEYVDREILGEN